MILYNASFYNSSSERTIWHLYFEVPRLPHYLEVVLSHKDTKILKEHLRELVSIVFNEIVERSKG